MPSTKDMTTTVEERRRPSGILTQVQSVSPQAETHLQQVEREKSKPTVQSKENLPHLRIKELLDI